MAKTRKKKTKASKLPPHPMDLAYESLSAKLVHVKPGSEIFKQIERYTKLTQGHRKCKVAEVFSVDRDGSSDRFSA